MGFLQSLSVLLFLSVSANIMAAESTFTAEVERVLVDDSRFGGCMVLLTTDPAETLPNCGRWWASLDCLKNFPESSGSIASNKLAQAQLALITGRSVTMRVTDTRVANGYCFAERIDVKDVRTPSESE